MFSILKRKKEKKLEDNSAKVNSDNYKMQDYYKSDNLVIGNLEQISSEVTPFGPMVNKTTQKYIFEKINENGKTRYREIFTGFIFDSNESSHYFDLPYVVNIVPLKDKIPTITEDFHKYSLLLILDKVNEKRLIRKLKR